MNNNPFKQTAADTKEFVLLHVDRVKLRLVDTLATLFNSIFAVFVVVLLACFVLMFLAIALTIAVAVWVNSYLWAVLIMAGIFIIATIIVYANRKKLVVNSMVRMLTKAFFEPDHDSDHE